MFRLSCHYRSTPRYHGVFLNVCPVLTHWWRPRHVSYVKGKSVEPIFLISIYGNGAHDVELDVCSVLSTL
jgi:hypothetical protein